MHYDPAENRRRSGWHFLPILGALAALSDLRAEQTVIRRSARSALRLTLLWLMLYALLNGAGESLGDPWNLRVFYLNGLLGAGYFLITMTASWRRLRP